MNNPPYQPYGGPPGQPPNARPLPQAPLSNSFRPFNPGQQPMGAPYQSQQQQFPPQQHQGPPSSGPPPGAFDGALQGMNIRPPQMMAGGPPRGFSGPPSGPPGMGGFPGGPQSQPGGAPPPQFNAPPQQFNAPPQQFNAPPQQFNAPPQQFNAPPQQFNAPPQGSGAPAPGFPGRAGPPMSQPTGFQPGGPAGLNRGAPTMTSGPPSAGAPVMARGPPGPGMGLGGPPQGMGLRGPPTGPLAGPPNANYLSAQFSQMGLGAPPVGGAPPMGGPPAAGAPPMMNAPGMSGPVRNGPPGPGNYNQPPAVGPPMNNQQPPQQQQAPPGPSYAPPSGNFQQPADMMDGGYNQQGQPIQQSPISDELMASQCDPRFMRGSVNAIPHSQDHAQKSGLTIGVIIRPLAPPEENEEIAVVNFGPSGVVRCRHCRTYMNPFVQWVDNGRRFRCNLCGVSNDVASSYFCHLNTNQQRQDRAERPELNSGTVEIVAPSEYMMRPPQPPCYMFVIDVSATAVSSGAVQIAVQTIREQLDNLPGAPRTRVGFVTYDSSIHFYNLKSTLKAPQMMVIADLDELFIPIPDELLVNLSDSREIIETLLDSLPAIHQNARSAETAMGPAIRVAFKLMSSIGGKMLVFQSTLPSTGQGALRNRENPRVLGTDKEQTLLNPIDTFYRSNAIDFCRQQVSVDTFLFSSQYQDVATIGSLSKFSAGQVYYYPGFTVEKDGEKFKKELAHCLVRETGWEAVMRVRCTKGMRLTNFYGNMFLRGPDLLALPTCHADSTFAIEITHSDALLSSTTISVQAGLLYTTSCGERRIRVHTICIPVTKLFAEVFRSVDVDSLCNIMAKNALEIALKTGLDSARTRLQNQCADIVRAYRNSGAFGANKQGGGYQLQLPESLQLLPLYVMSLLKNSALRGGTDLNPDERVFAQYQLNNMPVPDSRVFIYPRMFALHNMPPEAGLPLPEDQALTQQQEKPIAGSSRIVLPPVINLSIERLQCDGVFLLEDSVTLYMWVGRSAPPAFLTSLFGFPTMDGVDCKQVKLLAPHDDISRRVDNVLTAIRQDRRPFMNLVVMREGDPSEGRFFWKLVEDRASFNGGSYSYAEYLGQISRLSLSGSSGGR